MSYYYAKFAKENDYLTRVDTRIFLNNEEPKTRNGKCLGVVFLKNPGSAIPYELNKWEKLNLGKDKTLPWIKNVYSKVLLDLELSTNKNDYIHIINLFPLCEPDLCKALNILHKNIFTREQIMYDSIPFLFFAWGWEPELNQLREIYIESLSFYKNISFFVNYDYHNPICRFRIVDGLPTIGDKVKHTHGMPQNIVIEKIKEILLKDQLSTKMRLE